MLLRQQAGAEWKPVAYALRALSSTEQQYAQIEKEALASTWACERFAEFLIGKSFHIETDHKPQAFLLVSKILDELPSTVWKDDQTSPQLKARSSPICHSQVSSQFKMVCYCMAAE